MIEEVKDDLIVEKWISKFKSSEKLMRQEFLFKYLIAKKRLRSEHLVSNKNTDRMSHKQVNLVYSIGTALKNSIYFKSPNVNLKAREEQNHDYVENTEVKVNDILKDLKVKRTIERSIWDAYLGGFGCVYTDYIYDDKPAGFTIDPITGESVPTQERIVLENDIYIKRLRPDLVRFPRGFDFYDFQDSPWIGFDIIMPLEEAKEVPNWDQAQRDRLQGEKYSKISKNSDITDDSEELYVLIHYCFIKPKKKDGKYQLLVFSKSCTSPLQQVEYSKGHVGYPIKFLVFNPLDDDSPYPNGDPWIWESQLSAVDQWWKVYLNHVKRCNPKTIYDSGKITDKEAEKLKSNNDLEWVGVSNKAGTPISTLFYEKERAQVNQDVTNFFTVSRQLLSELAPKSGLTRGAQDAKPDSATEAKIIATGETIDIEARIDDVRDFIEDIVLDIVGILTQINGTMSVTKTVEVQDPNTGLMVEEEIVQEVGKEGFTSSVIVDVDVESMQAQNKDVFRRQIIDALGMLTKLEPILNRAGKTLNAQFWIEKLMDSMAIRNADQGIMDLQNALGIMNTPQGIPPAQEEAAITGERDPLATELGLAQRV